MTDIDRAEIQAEVDANFEFFKMQLSQLLIEHFGKFVLLRHKSIINYFDTFEDAQKYAENIYTDRLYSIQKIEQENSVNLGFVGQQFYA